jgi:hypothetical protein
VIRWAGVGIIAAGVVSAPDPSGSSVSSTKRKA